MRILIVLNCDYPNNGTGTNLIKRLLFDGGLLEYPVKIDVLCGKNHYDDLDYELIDQISVFRTTSWTVLPLDDVKRVSKSNPGKAVIAVLEKSANKIIKRIGNNFFADWFATRAYYKSLRKINAKEYDVIISMSGRYYNTAAVMKYCKTTLTKFIFYQVDPLGSNREWPYRTKKKRTSYEKELYRNAAYVFTTPLIFKENQAIFDKNIIDHVEAMEFPLVSPSSNNVLDNSHEPAMCVFSGSIYGGIRDPKYTIRLFSSLISNGIARVSFVGVEKDCISEELQDINITYTGMLPMNDAKEIVKQADFLINIGNSITNQVPSKIFDYISTGKPIINICKSRDCSTLPYLRKYPLALNLYEEDECFDEQVKLLTDFIFNNRGKNVEAELICKLYETSTPRYCAKRIMDLLDKID